jgi:hypothetical protein
VPARRPATEIERFGVADPEQLSEDQIADHRAGEAEDERGEQALWRPAGHQAAGDEAGEQAEDDPPIIG